MAKIIFIVPDEMLEETESHIKRRDKQKGDLSKICRTALSQWLEKQKKAFA